MSIQRLIGTFVVLGLIGGAVWIGLAWGDRETATPDPLKGEAFEISRQMGNAPEVTMNVPEGWAIQPFEDDIGMVVHVGSIVSNQEHAFHYPDLGPNAATTAWDMRGLPEDLVAMEVSRNLRFPIGCRETTLFPLQMTDGEWSPSAYGSPRRLFISACVKGRLPFGVHMWIGDSASKEDVTDLERLLESIQPLQ